MHLFTGIGTPPQDAVYHTLRKMSDELPVLSGKLQKKHCLFEKDVL